GHAQVFTTATTYTALLFLNKMPTDFALYSKIDNPSDIANTAILWRKISSKTLSEKPWMFASTQENNLAEKLKINALSLGDLPSRIGRGSSSGADDIFILQKIGNTFVTRQGEKLEIET